MSPARRAAVLGLALALLGWARCDAQAVPCEAPAPPAAPWRLVWADEFDGPAGQSPDPSRWGYDVGNGTNGWGNGQLEYDTDRPENAALDGQGHLALTARRERFTAPDGRVFDYTSARLLTRGKLEHARGRFEAGIQLPVGQGIWPAFWLLGADFPQVGWPACGEIDVMEYRGQVPQTVQGSLHGPGYSGGAALWRTYTLPGGARFDSGFHVFAVEWDDGVIRWLVDEVPYQTLTRCDLPPDGRWVFDHPFFVILNVAVGGGFVGSPDASTPFPQSMLVDWVHVYDRAP